MIVGNVVLVRGICCMHHVMISSVALGNRIHISSYHRSGKKKEHSDKLCCLDTFQCGGGLPCEGGGVVQKFGVSLEAQGK